MGPESYDAVLDELQRSDRKLSLRTRQSLAMEAFAYTARYDASIARWFAEREEDFPAQYTRSFEKVLDLPYGENPHQRAAYYAETGVRTHLMSMVSKLHGKELSFNNLLDLDSGRRLIEEFELPAVAIIKHNNPCGTALGAALGDAFEKALATDPQSAFGGVFCFNRPVDRALAEKLSEMFVEAVFAPGYDEDAFELLQQKPNVRLLENQERRNTPVSEHDFKRVRGGMLVQDRDTGLEVREEMQVATERKPTEEEWGELLFGLRVCKHVRSNAIVMTKGLGTVGHRRGADEPRGLGADRDREGGRGGAEPRRRRAGVRRVLPVRRRPAAGDRRGRPGDHPARRITARPGGRRRLRRSGRRDGVHGPQALPTLISTIVELSTRVGPPA